MSGPRRGTSVLLTFGALAAVAACAVWGLAPLPMPEDLSTPPSPTTAPAEPQHAGARLVREGITTAEEVARVVETLGEEDLAP